MTVKRVLKRRFSVGWPTILILIFASHNVDIMAAAANNRTQKDPDDKTRIALRYDSRLLAIGLTSPFVRLTIANQEVLFMVDTGASVHTFASWLVRAAALPTQGTTATAQGSTGYKSSLRVISAVMATFPGVGSYSLSGVVVDFPPLFEQYRIGGLLSPQLFAAGGLRARLCWLDGSCTSTNPRSRRSRQYSAGSLAKPDGCGLPVQPITRKTRSTQLVPSQCYFLPRKRMRAVKARPWNSLKVRKWVESMLLFTTSGFLWPVMFSMTPRSPS